MRIVLAGGSGALGRRLAEHFTDRGHDVVILTRSRRPALPFRQVLWDGRTVGGWADELSGAVLINLAGELVDRRPTPENVALLTDSRVRPTATLAKAAESCAEPPAVWLQASTTAVYGDRGDEILNEEADLGPGPAQMVEVARAWEHAAEHAPAARRLILRTGIVLDVDTPALDRLVRLTQVGLGARIGSGQQWVSWLHIDDYLAIVEHLIDSTLSGTLNVTSPYPVRNIEMMTELRRALARPSVPMVPAFAVRWGASLLGTDPALALTGRRCVPERLLESGFHFTFPAIRCAFTDLLRV